MIFNCEDKEKKQRTSTGTYIQLNIDNTNKGFLILCPFFIPINIYLFLKNNRNTRNRCKNEEINQ